MYEKLAQEYLEYDRQGRIWGNVPRERIRKIKFPRIGKHIIEQYLLLDDLTSTISDVLDSLGLIGAVPASYLSPLTPGRKLAGTAVTIRSIPVRITPTQGHLDKEFIRMATRDLYYLAEAGDVAVADFGGNLDVSNMGGQSCAVARSRGLAGAIVNGAVRDVNAIRRLDYPVWCRGQTPISGKHRIEAIEINGPVTLHNVVVNPGDLIVADDSGVCVVPAERAESVLDTVSKILAAESRMRELISSNAPIAEQKEMFRKRYE
jgi:4-hydroxy-4-methyl-2-oxoglutarate aldolase